ncbi:hypothetical protein EDB19DRAFT_1836926 [Suillus lakei]|nr:hypothetical protein EDB19DRAFT_1836926 [Suillus lakei]
MLDLAETKKMASKLKYNNARSALLMLGPLLGKVAWEESLRVLHVTDMRPLGNIALGQSEGTQDISWIWKAPGALHSDDVGLQDYLDDDGDDDDDIPTDVYIDGPPPDEIEN